MMKDGRNAHNTIEHLTFPLWSLQLARDRADKGKNECAVTAEISLWKNRRAINFRPVDLKSLFRLNILQHLIMWYQIFMKSEMHPRYVHLCICVYGMVSAWKMIREGYGHNRVISEPSSTGHRSITLLNVIFFRHIFSLSVLNLHVLIES